MLIRRLLKHAAQPPTPIGDGNLIDAFLHAHQPQRQWAMDAGLGPMLFRATRQASNHLPESLEKLLLSAELTAKVHHAAKVDTALDVLEICSAVGAPATLLKGISISEQCYERPHERAMTDVDVLVPDKYFPVVEAAALRRGYEFGLNIMGPNPHHGEPLVHPETRAKVEIHTALFQEDSQLRLGELFSPASMQQRSIQANLRGQGARRLQDELQLVYIASYWVNDLSENPMDASFLTPLFDTVLLLHNAGAGFDWDRLLAMLDNEVATAALYVLLSYIGQQQYIAVPDYILVALRQQQRIVGAPERGVLLAMIDQYLVGGQPFKWFNSWHLWRNLLEPGSHSMKLLKLPWRIAFPPTYADRFDTGAQARRLARWITR